MDSNKTAIETLLYRRERLDAKCEQIKDLVSGSDESFVELISTQSGKYSKVKVKKLVDALIENLKEYRSYKEMKMEPFGTKMKPVTLKKKEQEFYEAYFRMMIGLSLYNNSDVPDAKFSNPGTWNALQERIISLYGYNEAAEMYRDIICSSRIGYLYEYPIREPHGVINDMWSAYREVADGYFMDLIPKEGKKRAFELMTPEEADLIKKDDKKPGTIARMQYEQDEEWEKEQHEFWEMVDKGEIKWDPDPYEEENEDEEDEFETEYIIDNIPAYDDKENVKKWVDFFPDKDQFVSDCKLILENIVDMANHHGLIDEAYNALQLYLAKSGRTKWLIDDDYFTIYTYLNKALKASKKVVER